MFSKWKLSCLLLIGIVVALDCGCQEQNRDYSTTVRGTVTDSISGLPLTGAEIYLNDTTPDEPWYVTDSTGAYSVWSWGVAEWTVYCLVEGYQTKSRYVRSEHNVEGVDFEMAPE
ncbi:MAG: carboxypeptidase-like regulatory domain-containing protein [candidate division Zixibacteria bacterium]|nr:carboxypeptidase-like regulatory domain-containing protein [candidate division Zixibacteria bacterium]